MTSTEERESLAALPAELRARLERIHARYEDPAYVENLARLEREALLDQTQQDRYVRERALLAAQVPKDTWDFLDAPRDAEALAAMREFLAGSSLAKDGRRPRFLVLAGPVGRGKTFALSWAVSQAGGRFVTAQELVVAGMFDRELRLHLVRAPLLALDELGTEKANDAFLAVLFDVLDSRYREGRRTAISTNLDGAAFKAGYLSGPLARLHDRIATAGTWVNLPGESMRGRRTHS